MRHPGTNRALTLGATVVALVLLAMPWTALATHGPTVEAVVAVATSEQWNMACVSGESSVECSAQDFDFTWSEMASVRPASGSLISLYAAATVLTSPLDSYFRSWLFALHGVGCAPDRISAGQLSSFITAVADRTAAGTVTPATITGECDLTGGLTLTFLDGRAQYTYWVSSAVVIPATPTPMPSPSPTPAATATPTPPPPVTPRPSAAVTPRASSTPIPTASLGSTPTGSPTPSPTLSATATATATSMATPEQQVAGGNPTPSPAASEAGAPGPTQPALGNLVPGALVGAITSPGEMPGDIGALGRSVLLAILLLLFAAFAAELFNSTLESHYDEVVGWFAFIRHRGGQPSHARRLLAGPAGLVLFLALGALVYALLDPGFGLGLGALATYLGLLVGLLLVLVAFEAPGIVLYRRRTGELPGLRALPWTLPAAIVCVLLSRVADLQPGYLYGILLGVVFRTELTTGEEGRQAAAGAIWTLLVAVGAWLGLGWLRAEGSTLDPFLLVLAETALATAVVGGLESVALGLVPMRFLAGFAVYAWSRLAWAAIFAIGAFAFVYVLIGPQTGYLSQLTPSALIAACGAFAAFGAFSVAFWSYFRFRPARMPG